MNAQRLVLDPLVLAAEHDRTVGTFAGLESADHAAREVILHRAYAIWESEGCPPDRTLANWLDAEAEVMRVA